MALSRAYWDVDLSISQRRKGYGLRLLKGIIEKLISYAHGREVTLADRGHVDAVFESIAEEDFSLRATIHAIVAHSAFGRK